MTRHVNEPPTPTDEQAEAIALMHGWGWEDVVPYRRHFIRLANIPGWRWCASDIIRYSKDTATRSASGCPKHMVTWV